MATNVAPAFPPVRADPRQVLNTLKRTINFNDPDIAAAPFPNSLPANAFIVQVLVEIITVFNAGTTNPLTVGTVGAAFNNVVADADVNEAATGVTAVVRGLGRSLTAAGETAVFAKYAPTGAAATTGKAIITIVYDGGWAS